MFHTAIKAAEWIALPILLIAGMFTGRGGEHEFLITLLVCTGAVVVAARQIWIKEYLLAVGFASIAVVFSPFFLVTKVFLLMSLAVVVTFLTLVVAFRRQNSTAENDMSS